MKLETFFEKFDQFADAPDAVARLRDVVYSVELAAEKWPHESLESVALKVTDGTHQTPRYVETGIPFVSVKDFSGGSLDMSATRFITSEEHGEIYKRCDPKRGDILLGRIGTIGKAVVVDTDIEFSLFVSAAQIRPDRGKILSRYLQYVLNSPFCRAQFDNIKVGGATHTNKLNLKDLRSVRIPLPPLAEQKRIVAKVDELMALCDRLALQQEERETRHAALARASLSRFADAPTPANLHFLFHPSYTISAADLRKSILTLAVQGKLVPQDPNDEPAASLISQIAKEKRRLVAAGIIREKDEVAPIADDELPFEVPYGWEWTRLSSITRRIHYGYTASAKSELKDVRLLRITDIQNNFVDWSSVPGCEIAKDEVAQYQLERSDILVARTGGTVGKTYLVQEVPVVAVFASYLIRIQGGSALFDRYLKLFLESPTYWVQLEEGARGAAQPNVNGQTLGRMVVSVPPLAEQRRIVAKVEQLMALVDALELQLAASRATAENLLAAVVAELTEGTHASPAC